MPRGGKRPGAGRPTLVQCPITLSVRISRDDAEHLDEIRGENSRAEEVRKLIREARPTKP